MRPYIVATDLTDNIVAMAVEKLRERFGYDCDVTEFNAAEHPDAADGTNIYLVGHADAQAFDEYNDPGQMLKDHDFLELVFQSSRKIILMSCEAGGIPVNDDGFSAKNFAENLTIIVNKPVDAAVGPVRADTLEVMYEHNAESVGSNDGWFRFDTTGQAGGDPFGFE